MPQLRPSQDRTRGNFYRRPSYVLSRERIVAATVADLPILREALAQEFACRRHRQKLIVALILRINELTFG